MVMGFEFLLDEKINWIMADVKRSRRSYKPNTELLSFFIIVVKQNKKSQSICAC